jgi:hypothetical protein
MFFLGLSRTQIGEKNARSLRRFVDATVPVLPMQPGRLEDALCQPTRNTCVFNNTEIYKMKSSSSPTPAKIVLLLLMLLWGALLSFNGKFNAVRVFNNRGDESQSSIRLRKDGTNTKSEIIDHIMSTKRKYLRRNLQLTDDRFNEVLELSVTRTPAAISLPTMSPNKVDVQPQEQSNWPTIDYSHSPSSAVTSIMKHSSRPPSDMPSSQPSVSTLPTSTLSELSTVSGQPSLMLSQHLSVIDAPSRKSSIIPTVTVVQSLEQSNPQSASSAQLSEPSAHSSVYEPSGQPSLEQSLPTSPTLQPGGHLPESESCPPAYDPSIAWTYDDGSEVEVHGIIYRCNPYPFAIYCTMHSYRPESIDNEFWKDSWVVVSACVVPSSTEAPTMTTPSARPTTQKPTESPTSQEPTGEPSLSPSYNPTPQPTLLPSFSPSSRLWVQPSGRPTKMVRTCSDPDLFTKVPELEVVLSLPSS